MTPNDATAYAAAEDIYYGQTVCIWARWFVVATATLLILWSAEDSGSLARRICLVLGMVAINFFLQGRQMIDRPANGRLVMIASLVDLGLIAIFTGLFSDTNGFNNSYFVLLYPVVFAFALVFEQRLTAIFTGIALTLYGLICLLDTPSLLAHADDAKTLAMRLITLAAMGGLGTYYWRIQRQRRAETVSA